MNTGTQDNVALVARILLAVMFIISGFGKITGFEGTVGYIASKGLPLPQLVAIGTILVELGGGLMLAVGFKARWAALALAVFTLLAAIIFHNFWAADAAAKTMQQIQFMKNISIVGGMLMVFAFGPGRLSVDKS